MLETLLYGLIFGLMSEKFSFLSGIYDMLKLIIHWKEFALQISTHMNQLVIYML